MGSIFCFPQLYRSQLAMLLLLHHSVYNKAAIKQELKTVYQPPTRFQFLSLVNYQNMLLCFFLSVWADVKIYSYFPFFVIQFNQQYVILMLYFVSFHLSPMFSIWTWRILRSLTGDLTHWPLGINQDYYYFNHITSNKSVKKHSLVRSHIFS